MKLYLPFGFELEEDAMKTEIPVTDLDDYASHLGVGHDGVQAVILVRDLLNELDLHCDRPVSLRQVLLTFAVCYLHFPPCLDYHCPQVFLTADIAALGLYVILRFPALPIPYKASVVEVPLHLVDNDLVQLDEPGVGEVHTDSFMIN